jgi:hypothetical protein
MFSENVPHKYSVQIKCAKRAKKKIIVGLVIGWICERRVEIGGGCGGGKRVNVFSLYFGTLEKVHDKLHPFYLHLPFYFKEIL